MKIVKPNDITLLSSNVSESLHTEWSSGTSYVTGNRVYVTLESDGTTERTPHRIFEAITSNSGNYPPDSPSQWVLVGSTNRWAMFDEFVSSQTKNASSIDVTIGASGDQIALLDVDANSVDVTTRDSGGTQLASETRSLVDPFASDWFEYFFAPISRRRSLLYALPSGTAEIDLSIYAGVNSKVGTVLVGDQVEIATAEYDTTISFEDFSRNETNDYGETTLVERDFARILEVPLFMNQADTATVIKRISDVRGKAVLWDANEDGTDIDSLRTYGFFRDFDVDVSAPNDETYTLEIRGLT